MLHKFLNIQKNILEDFYLAYLKTIVSKLISLKSSHGFKILLSMFPFCSHPIWHHIKQILTAPDATFHIFSLSSTDKRYWL